MPTQEGILTVILVAIVANLLVAVGLLVGPRLRRRRMDRDESAEINRQVLMRAHLFGGGSGSAERSAAMSERPSFHAPQAPFADRTGLRAAPLGTPPSTVPAAEADDSDDLDRAADFDEVDQVRPGRGESSPTDPVTGFDGPATWAKRLTEENARVQRYGRAATVVLVELAGLDRLAERLGPAAAERLIPPLATTMRRNARSADSLARLSPTRFAALLPDTDEVKAINYIERVRSACDVWLEAGAVALRLSVGWAELSVNQPVDPAILSAERRLNEERQRFRSRDARDGDDDRDVVAAQMRPVQAN
jgi:diguanylate cyclase (GGDEF)-like protein